MENISRTENRGNRSFWLDVLRTFLCIGVLVYHYTPERPSSGPMCVDGFFVLSGYLLAAAFTRMKACGGMDVCAFYQSKSRRLLPTLVMSLLFGLLYHAIKGNPLLPSWQGSEFRMVVFVEYYNVPAWYMISEIAFLSLAPFLFFIYMQGKKAVVALFFGTAAFAAWLYCNVPFAAPFGAGLYFEPQVRLWQFVGGILAYALFQHVQMRPWMKVATYALFAFATVLLAVLALVKQSATLHNMNYTFCFDAVMVLIFMVLIPGLAKLKQVRGVYLGNLFAFLASLTYPIYLYHVPVYRYVFNASGKILGYNIGDVAIGLTSAVATIILSVLSLKYLDGIFKPKRTVKGNV